MRALIPRMSVILEILLPTTLPSAKSAEVVDLSALERLTANSGRDVPRATIVKPINKKIGRLN